MKCIVLYIILFASSINSYSQDTTKVDNSSKLYIIKLVIERINSDFIRQYSYKKVYCQINLKEKYIYGHGIDFSPEIQDTSYTTETSLISKVKDLVSDSFKNKSLDIFGDENMGKINRSEFLYNHLAIDSNKVFKSRERLYMYISEPIDGWDFIKVISNNFYKKIAGVESNPILKSNVYYPIVISYVGVDGKIIIEHWLYNFIFGIEQKKGYYFTYQSRQKLNISN